VSATQQMTAWTGYLDNAGSPRLKIILRGVWEGVEQELDAIVDTGFTGFLSMPMVDAFPLGLVLYGTTTTILADGSTSYKLMAVGTACVGQESKLGIVLLNMGAGPSAVLIGMEFLRIFNKSLLLIRENVILVDSPPTPPEKVPTPEGEPRPAPENPAEPDNPQA
jgi:predicted aspartyl protease